MQAPLVCSTLVVDSVHLMHNCKHHNVLKIGTEDKVTQMYVNTEMCSLVHVPFWDHKSATNPSSSASQAFADYSFFW